jgi:hypothetical protein
MCFLNMATVAGDPDLAAVRLYERLRLSEEARLLERRVSGEDMEAVLAEVRCRYRDDAQFASFQGPTATARDLHNAVDGDADVWFGSHLYHHWDMRLISSEVYRRSLAADAEALAHYPNALPGFATPHGYDGDGDDQVFALARSAGHRAVFTVTRRQNDSCEGGVLDRLALPSARSTGRDWWYATHRARLVKRAKMR